MSSMLAESHVSVVVAEEAVRELPIPPWSFGVLALVAFALLLAFTWSFRGTAQKYVRPDPTGHRTEPSAGLADTEVERARQPERPEHQR
ncbi:MAG: hypothetical protein ACRCXL_12455 [Dermatophilaceae bacterium]